MSPAALLPGYGGSSGAQTGRRGQTEEGGTPGFMVWMVRSDGGGGEPGLYGVDGGVRRGRRGPRAL